MRVVWEEDALADLAEIEGYIAADSPRAARAVKQRIRQQVLSLSEAPRIGRPGRVKGTRELMVTGLPYIVVYTVTESVVTVLAVYHGARQWPESFSRRRGWR
jgi:toxin ParE1/3/4